MEKTLTITRYPRALGEVSSQVAGQQWVYQLTRAFQLSPTEFGLLVNIRLCAIRPVDIETGNDLVILDRLDQVEPKATIPLNRGEFGIHPRTVQRLLLSRYPLAGGFIPVGACRADGSPHPHAGTGFAVSHVLGYPVDDAGNVAVYGLWEIPEADRHVMFELQQYRYDGATFTVEHSEMLNPEAVLPGWVFTSSPLSNSIADGDDLIGGFVGYRVGSAAATAGSGMTRWKWRDGRWRLMEFTPVPEAEGAFEPSMVRDGDNSLLFAVRGSSRSVLGEKEDPQKKILSQRCAGLAVNRLRCDVDIGSACAHGTGRLAGLDQQGGGWHHLCRRQSALRDRSPWERDFHFNCNAGDFTVMAALPGAEPVAGAGTGL